MEVKITFKANGVVNTLVVDTYYPLDFGGGEVYFSDRNGDDWAIPVGSIMSVDFVPAD